MTKLGIVKNYLKFCHDALFGVIGCENSNIVFLPNRDGSIGQLCMVGFAEDAIIWNIELGQIVKTFHGNLSDKVTCMSYFLDISGIKISIGYESGYVSIYELSTYELVASRKIHKHSISYILHFEDRLICGSKDTTITDIDIFAEKGYKLEGHKSPITKLHYIKNKDVLISSSQDGEIKFWLLSYKRCIKTLINPSAVWDFNYWDNRNLLVTGSSDTALRLWKLSFNKIDSDPFSGSGETTMTDRYSNVIQATSVPGEVTRNSPKRVIELKTDNSGNYLMCNTHEKCFELYKVLSEAELKKRIQKKIKKAAKTNQDSAQVCITATDRLKLLKVIELPYRCKSIDLHFVPENKKKNNGEHLVLLASMYNNIIAVFLVGLTDPNGKLSDKNSKNVITSKSFTMKESISEKGHRTAIIHCQFTSDNTGVFTVSLSEAKLWNKSDRGCMWTAGWAYNHIRENNDLDKFKTIFTELGLVQNTNLEANKALLLPGDRHALIGFKNGAMFLYDINSAFVMQYMKKHNDNITSLVLNHDQTCVLSAGADKCLLVWKLEYSKAIKTNNRGNLSLVCSGNPEPFKNGISSLAVTPDGKLVIIGFLDNKVRTYLTNDTSRRILDLYGHTQPVTSISVKHDSSQLLTGSGDKTVRLWNLPNGDCKLFKGHNEPVTDVKYIPGRSMAFSCDKSGLIIQIDLKDLTQMIIIKLTGHSNSVSSLAVIASGTEDDDDDLEDAELLSVSTDRSIRLWYESQEILVKLDELIEENSRIYEKEVMANEKIVIVGAPQDTVTNVLTVKTISTENAGDNLMEAIDIYDKMRLDPEAPIEPIMIAKKFTDPALFVMHTVTMINKLDLELTLAQLPYQYVPILLDILADQITRDLHVFLANRCFLYLFKLHFMRIKDDQSLLPCIQTMEEYAELLIQKRVDNNGCDQAFLEYHDKFFGPEFLTFTEQRKVKKPKSKKKNRF